MFEHAPDSVARYAAEMMGGAVNECGGGVWRGTVHHGCGSHSAPCSAGGTPAFRYFFTATRMTW